MANWLIHGKNREGEFKWLINSAGEILDCPYHLRGLWVGRRVDMEALLTATPPQIRTYEHKSQPHDREIVSMRIDVVANIRIEETDLTFLDHQYDAEQSIQLVDPKEDK